MLTTNLFECSLVSGVAFEISFLMSIPVDSLENDFIFLPCKVTKIKN